MLVVTRGGLHVVVAGRDYDVEFAVIVGVVGERHGEGIDEVGIGRGSAKLE